MNTVRLKCVSSHSTAFLTEGKEYTSSHYDNDGYYLQTDSGCYSWKSKGHFIVLKDEETVKPEPESCSNCANVSVSSKVEPCSSCLGVFFRSNELPDWTPRATEVTNDLTKTVIPKDSPFAEVRQDCDNCKHSECEINVEPCLNCAWGDSSGKLTLWEPKVTEEPAKNPEPPTSTSVYRPAHYARFAVEPVEFVMRNNLPYAVGNVIKYVCRWDAKDGIQDLKKAARYLEMFIKQQEGDEDFAK